MDEPHESPESPPLAALDFATLFPASIERGAALSAVALLDAAVGSSIRGLMISDSKAAEEEFGQYGQLGSFGSKVRFAYLFGLIKKITYKELTIINKIRNEFAHNKDADSFNFPRIQGLSSSLIVHHDRTYILNNIYYFLGLKAPTLITATEADKFFATLRPQFDPSAPNWAFMLEVIILTQSFNKLAYDRGKRPPLAEPSF